MPHPTHLSFNENLISNEQGERLPLTTQELKNITTRVIERKVTRIKTAQEWGVPLPITATSGAPIADQNAVRSFIITSVYIVTGKQIGRAHV